MRALQRSSLTMLVRTYAVQRDRLTCLSKFAPAPLTCLSKFAQVRPPESAAAVEACLSDLALPPTPPLLEPRLVAELVPPRAPLLPAIARPGLEVLALAAHKLRARIA